MTVFNHIPSFYSQFHQIPISWDNSIKDMATRNKRIMPPVLLRDSLMDPSCDCVAGE